MTHFSHLTNGETGSIEVEQFSFRDRSGIKAIFDNINVSIHFHVLRFPHALSLLPPREVGTFILVLQMRTLEPEQLIIKATAVLITTYLCI